MGQICQTASVKLILGIISSGENLISQALDKLSTSWGEADLLSPIIPFDYTEYYKAEMGTDLLRQFVSFERLIKPQNLASCKVFSNETELYFAGKGNQRKINLDPGYLDESKLVLASTKNFAQRIYLDQGIFAEVTLQFKRRCGWQDLPWTYPDYRLAATKDFLSEVRLKYRQQIKDLENFW
ncbi:MAG: DUF4416 family protein [Candidatus Schekmanbacteria bacterium]|nr:DUF4416 family protein [Candidatus Schekmanbacteria bacterium]